MKKIDDQTCIIGPVRMSFAKVYEPELFMGKMKYSAVLLIPKDANGFQPDPKAEGRGITECVKFAWEDRFGTKQKPPSVLLDGDADEKQPGYWYLKVSSDAKYAPKVIGPAKEPVGKDSGWQSGDWANVKVYFAAWEMDGRKGVSAYLNAVQWAAKDEPFGKGARDDDDDFDTVAMVDSSEDPFA